jgi:hypothetical protein
MAEQGQTDRQRRQTEQPRRAKQLYDAAREASGVERALAQLAQLSAEADLERAARGEMEAAHTVRAQCERDRTSVARERDEALDALQAAQTERNRAEARARAAAQAAEASSRAAADAEQERDAAIDDRDAARADAAQAAADTEATHEERRAAEVLARAAERRCEQAERERERNAVATG